MIDEPAHSLTFGDLIWVEEGANPPDASGVVYRVKAQDATLGTAVPVTTALLWLGSAGGPVSYDHTPNREPLFRVTVEADDSDLLARGEMALQLACEQPTTLVWTPPDGASVPSVFDIVWSHLEPVFEPNQSMTGVGMEEAVRGTRTYLIKMQALPYARAAELITTVAAGVPGSPPVTTVVDNGSAVSGAGYDWTVTDYPGHLAVASSSGLIKMVYTGLPFGGTFRFYRNSPSSPVDTTGYNYVAVDMTATVSLIVNSLTMHGSNIKPVVLAQDLGTGVTRYFFELDSFATSFIFFELKITPGGGADGSYIGIDQVQLFDKLPDLGTGRQRTLSLVPGGSVRAQGSIQVAHATNALGKVVVYTHPAGTGYLPPLRPWLKSSEAVTTDSSRVSGARHAIGTDSTVYELPVGVLPKGRVEVWAWLRETSEVAGREIFWAVKSYMGDNELTVDVLRTDVNFAVINTWYLVCLGSAVLPPIDLGPSGTVQVHLNCIVDTVEVDETYLFATDHGSLTIVDCGTGTVEAGGPSNRLWIDAPFLDQPMGAIYRGNAADRSDQWHAGGQAAPWGQHDFDPRGTSVFVATAGTTNAETSLTHYRRYNTFVVRET